MMLRNRQTKRHNEAVSELQHWLHTTAIYLEDIPSVMVQYMEFLKDRMQMLDLVDEFRVVVFCPEDQMLIYRLEKKTGYQVTFNEINREEYQQDNANNNEHQTKPLVMRLQEGEEYVRIRKHELGCRPESFWWFHVFSDCYVLPARYPKSLNAGKHNALEGMVIWATNQEQGFSNLNIDFINATFPALWAIFRSQNQAFIAKRLLRSYLGQELGARASNGSVVRGNVFSARSVIWISDIRQFSKLANGPEQEEIVEVISTVCQITSDTVFRNSGEILKITGGKILAVWKENPFHAGSELITGKRFQHGDDHRAKLCAQARKAARELQQELESLRSSKKAGTRNNISVGIGLHYGQCSYGIAGATSHMDLVAIGPCINLASKIEGLCSKLQASILASEDFVNIDGANKEWQGRGSYSIRGANDPIMIFQLNA